MRSLVLICLCFCWSYARTSETPKIRKAAQMKELPPMFVTEQVGKSVTLNCPVRPSVARMYRYLRRIKTGKELEHARRKMALLLGVKYRWFKDGKSIRHHRSAWFMKLQAIQLHDAGLYTCKVVMPKDGTSRNFTLKVFRQSKLDRPIIQSKSKNISLRVGESTTLQCICKSRRERPQINWLKRNEPNELNGPQNSEFGRNDIKTESQSSSERVYKLMDPKLYLATSKKLRGKRDKSYEFRLRLRNVQEKDSGDYVCLVKNRYGSDYRRFLVNVKSLKGVAPYPTNPEKMRRLFMAWPASSSIKLRCYVTGDKPLTYQWYKDGKMLLHRRLDPRLNSTTWALRLRDLVPSDSGIYTCRVSNPYGAYQHNITLKVIERIRSAPILLNNYPRNVTATRGKNVSFECIELVSGPLPDYRWYKWHSIPAGYPKLDVTNTSQFTIIDPIHYNTIQVKAGQGYRYGGRLTLKNITQSDVGLYTCVVRNHIGMDYSSAFLSWQVNKGPKFISSVNRPTVIDIPATALLKLDCDATGNPKPNISWFRNGERLTLGQGVAVSNYTLKLKELLPEQSGNYSCLVKNMWGSIKHTFNVRIKERLFTRPIIVPSAKKVLKSGESYELKCTIVSAEPPVASMTRNLGTNMKIFEILTREAKLVKLDRRVYQYSYVIRNATISDSGSYWCIARNAVGESQRMFQIQVED